jgi:hypothetical protein
MAGFDTSKQRIFKLNGAYLETGRLAFSGADLTLEVPTKLTKKIISGKGVTSDSTAVYQDGVITAGAVTFTRPAGGSADAVLDYELIGY